MALLESLDLPLFSKAPHFTLPSVDGKTISLQDYQNKKAIVLLFICAHCPYVKAVESRLLNLAREMQKKEVQFLAICSNNWKDYPEDSPEALLKLTQEKNYPFPYLIDESQEVAKAYQAVCTPDIFVLDGSFQLVYHGRIDDNWKDENKVGKQELKDALEFILQGKTDISPQYPSMGCSIKWK